MNFVDAIRQAAALHQPSPVVPTANNPEVVRQPVEAPIPAPTQKKRPAKVVQAVADVAEGNAQEDTVVTSVEKLDSGESVVRIELRLTPEQTQSLLTSALNTSHRYMTLREAARYLRISNARLEQIASAGDIPAFKLEDSWRFEKKSLDDWATELTKSGSNHKESAA